MLGILGVSLEFTPQTTDEDMEIFPDTDSTNKKPAKRY